MEPGWKKIRIRDEHSRAFSESLEKVFRVKKLKFLDADPVSDSFWPWIRIRDGKV
jgi:hypothetical protein